MTLGERAGARISLTGVGRRFSRAQWVFKDLSLQIEPGEFVSLLGPSGCGKSTLLRLIAGLDRADEGRVAIDSFGREFFRGFVFQDAQLLPWRTALANTALPLELMGCGKAEAKERAEFALARVGLGDSLDKYPSQLSGGMRMRCSVARALVVQPSLLLLDEPFAALDENTRHRLQEQLRGLWETERMTVVFVTHSVSEAVYLSSRSILLSRKPAKTLLDHRTSLPERRPASLRTETEFSSEIKAIHSAFAGEEEIR